MSGNKWWYTKVDAKLLSDLVIVSMLSSDIPLDFHNSIRVVPLKYIMYILAGRNTKRYWNIPKEKYFAPWRILSLFVESFLNGFVDIALTFFDSSFNSFLFDVTSFSLLSKSVFFTILPISFLLTKFACLSLALKSSTVNLFNCCVVIYLLWSPVIFFQFH